MSPLRTIAPILFILVLPSILCLASTNAESTATSKSVESFEWLPSYRRLVRSIIRLPIDDDATSAQRAVELIETYRTASPYGSIVPWTHRLGRLVIPLWEVRTFPNAREEMEKRLQYRESDSAQVYELEPENEEDEDDVQGERPKLIRASILHVLAGRGFEEAMKKGQASAIPSNMWQSEFVHQSSCSLSSFMFFAYSSLLPDPKSNTLRPRCWLFDFCDLKFG